MHKIKILKLSKDYQENRDLDKTIYNAKPPIFWKDKEIVKQQINRLEPAEITKLIIKINGKLKRYGSKSKDLSETLKYILNRNK